MLIVGERINATRPAIKNAIAARNTAVILKEARAQLANGAEYIDINCATGIGDEVQDIDWAISVIQSEIKDVNICIDSPNYLAIDRGLSVYKGKGGLMINSITAEESRMARILPLAIKYKAKVIALAMDEKGMPQAAEDRFRIAKKIHDRVTKGGLKADQLYFDPLVRPISTEPDQAREFLRSIPLIKGLGAKTICGASNVSFGLPNRSVINSAFLAMAVQAGLDAAIVDPLDKHVMSCLAASEALLGADEYCARYLKTFREGKLI